MMKTLPELQSFSRILADPTLKDAQHDVVEIMARMIDILAEASTSALDVVFSDIVTILITELDARRQYRCHLCLDFEVDEAL